EIAAQVMQFPEGTRLHLLFPIKPAAQPLNATVAGAEAKPAKRISAKARRLEEEAATATRSEALRNRLFELRKRGFSRLYQNATIFEFSTPESLLDIDFKQPVYVLVDRLAVTPQSETRARL